MNDDFDAELENAESAAAAANDGRRIATLEADLAKERETVKQLKREAQVADDRLAAALQNIEGQRQFRVTIPKGLASSKKGLFNRFIIADTHGCWINKRAAAAMLNDLELVQPSEIVLLGDHLDCAGWLAKHHPFKTVQEAKYSFSEDVAAANWFLDEVCKRAPNAAIHYLEGNHEERIEAWIVEQTQQSAKDAAYLRTMFSPEVVMGLAKRNIKYYRRTAIHGRMRLRGVLRLGKCHFVHGISHGKDAAKIHLQKIKHNVVFGHVHNLQSASTTDSKTEFGGWCSGCLCEFEPMWKHSQPTEWGHGYGVQIVAGDGSFLHLSVPVISGKSYLRHLIESAK